MGTKIKKKKKKKILSTANCAPAHGSPSLSLDRVFLHYGGCPVPSPQRGAGGRPAVAWLARSVVRLRLSGDVIHDAGETDTAGTLILASCSALPGLLNPDATLCC